MRCPYRLVAAAFVTCGQKCILFVIIYVSPLSQNNKRASAPPSGALVIKLGQYVLGKFCSRTH